MGLRAVIIRCPNCNANLEIVSTVASVACTYCGQVSRVEARKTAMFELPKTLPPPDRQSLEDRRRQIHELRQLVPVRAVSTRAVWLIVLVPTLVILGAVFGGIKMIANHVTTSRMMWAGHVPAVIDVDGDGVGDLVGLVRYVVDDDRTHLAAYSGKTGAKLWESDSLGNYSKLGQVQLASLGSLVVMNSSTGELIARDAKAGGAPKWQLSMGEKIDVMCKHGDGLVVATADGKWFAIDAGGSKQETAALIRLDRDYTNDGAIDTFQRADENTTCLPVGSTWRQPPSVFALQHWHDIANVPGMSVDIAVRTAKSPTIVLGHKSPGTAVPMLGRLAPSKPFVPTDRKERPEKEDLPGAAWEAEMPSKDKLNSQFDSAHFAMTDRLAIVLYEGANSTEWLTAFDLETGKRAWERQLETGHGFVAVCLVVTGDVVTLTTWQNLTAFKLSDGSVAWEIGYRM